MRKFDATRFIRLARRYERVRTKEVEESKDKTVGKHGGKVLGKSLKGLRDECRSCGFVFCAKHLDRIIMELPKTITGERVMQLMDGFLDRLEDETSSNLFLVVEPSKSLFWADAKSLFGEEVCNAFPSALIDMEEAGKCLAAGRSTACVFHLQRCLEVALRILAAELNVSYQDFKNWAAVLKRVDEELKGESAARSPAFRANKDFYAESAAMFRAVKDAWRNPTMHIENIYNQDKALEVFNAVKGFMRHLATRLHE